MYSMKILRSYIDELFEYMELTIYSSKDFILSVIFWRGQVYIGPLHLPLHSVVAFLSSVYAVETPRFLPSFFLFSIAYCMLVLMKKKQSHPSPWYRCKPVSCNLLPFLNISMQTHIRPGEGAKQSEALKVSWKERIEREKKMQSEITRLRSEIQKVLVGMGKKISIQTREEGDSLNPLTRLLPIQLLLKDFLCYIRLIKVVISWEESLFSLWFTCFSVVLGLLLLFLPWFSLLHCLARITVWSLLGPWMRFADIIYERKNSDQLRSMINTVRNQEQQIWKNTRLEREKVEKLKSIRTVCFGKYSFKVPSLNLTWHNDRPLPDSSAKYVEEDDSYVFVSSSLEKGRKIVPGQKNCGVMIPRIPQYSTKENRITLGRDIFPRCDKSLVEANGLCHEGNFNEKRRLDANKELIIPVTCENGFDCSDYLDEGIEIILSYHNYDNDETKSHCNMCEYNVNTKLDKSNDVCYRYYNHMNSFKLNEKKTLRRNYMQGITHSCNVLVVNEENTAGLNDCRDQVEIILSHKCDQKVIDYNNIIYDSHSETTVSSDIINVSFRND